MAPVKKKAEKEGNKKEMIMVEVKKKSSSTNNIWEWPTSHDFITRYINNLYNIK